MQCAVDSPVCVRCVQARPRNARPPASGTATARDSSGPLSPPLISLEILVRGLCKINYDLMRDLVHVTQSPGTCGINDSGGVHSPSLAFARCQNPRLACRVRSARCAPQLEREHKQPAGESVCCSRFRARRPRALAEPTSLFTSVRLRVDIPRQGPPHSLTIETGPAQRETHDLSSSSERAQDARRACADQRSEAEPSASHPLVPSSLRHAVVHSGPPIRARPQDVP